MSSVIDTEDKFDSLRWSPKSNDLGVEIVSNKFLDSLRWFELWEMVWREGDKFYAYAYQVPSTEYQEGSEEEFDPNLVYEVEPFEVTTTEYRKKK